MSWDGFDRRKFPRIIFPCLITVHSDGKPKEAILTHTENIGVGGVCVILKNHIERFTEVGLEIDLLDMQEHLRCNGRIVWNVRRNETQGHKPLHYDVGIEFIDLKDPGHKRLSTIIKNLMERGAAVVLKPYI